MLKQGNSWQTSFYAWESFPGAKNFVFSLDRLRDRGPQRQPSPATCPTPIYYLTAAYTWSKQQALLFLCVHGATLSLQVTLLFVRSLYPSPPPWNNFVKSSHGMLPI